MADLRSTYQPILKKIEDFLKKGIEEQTKENEKRLTTLRETYEILAGIVAEKGEVKEEASEVNQCIDLILGLCGTLLFGTYPELLTQTSDRCKMVAEMENKSREVKSGALPRLMQLKYDQVKSYLEKAKEQLKKIDNMLPEIFKKVRKAKIQKFKIPDEEICDLEMDIDEVNCELYAYNNYMTKVDEVLNMLKADLESEARKFGVKVIGAASGVAAVISVGGVIFAGRQIADAVLFLGNGGTIATGALAGVSLLVGFWSIIDNYKTSYETYVEELKLEKEALMTKYDNIGKKIKELLTNKMEGKN